MAPERILARVAGAQAQGMAVLAGHRLVFHKINRVNGSGKCDVQPSTDPGDAVYGALYRVTEDDLLVLDGFEGRATPMSAAILPSLTRRGKHTPPAFMSRWTSTLP